MATKKRATSSKAAQMTMGASGRALEVNSTAYVLNQSSVALIRKWEVKFIFRDGKNDNKVRNVNVGPGQNDSTYTELDGCVVGHWYLIAYLDGNGDPQSAFVETKPAPAGKCYKSVGVKLVDQSLISESERKAGAWPIALEVVYN